MPFQLSFSPEVADHLTFFDTAAQRRILDTIDRQLVHEPLAPTRNRKPMRSNLIATWELRIGDFRVYMTWTSRN